VTQAEAYIEGLTTLKEGELSSLRSLAGQTLDSSIQGFDIFTGLWWPLRDKNSAAPRREPCWLVAKLYSATQIPHVRPNSVEGPSLPAVLGRLEPPVAPRRFQTRFDALLDSGAASLEPHLRWALDEVARAIAGKVPHAREVNGIDWVELLNDLSIWDRGATTRRGRDVREIWAEEYLNQSCLKGRKA